MEWIEPERPSRRPRRERGGDSKESSPRERDASPEGRTGEEALIPSSSVPELEFPERGRPDGLERLEPEPERRPPRRPRRGIRSETGRRVLWAIPWIAFAILIVAAGGAAFTLALIVLGVVGLREYFGMTADARPLDGPAYLALAAILLAAHLGKPFQIIMVAAASFLVLFIAAAARQRREGITISMAVTVFGVAWIATGFAHAILLRDLPLHGGALLIDVLIATFVGDTSAYGAGKMFGTRKVTPRLSPNKTIEGFIGGFLGATMGFWFAGLYQDWLGGTEALIMGACVALVAPIGDLFASLIKRDRQVKDTGRLFGPHGGLIDRLDAVLFTVVIGYYLARAFVY